MIEVRKILFPTDFSPASVAALDHALLWAEVTDAELLLLHVLSLTTADPFNPEHHFPEPDELFDRLQTLADSEMAELLRAHREKPLRLREFVRRAPEVERGILDFAVAEKVDLILMGTHGRRGASHLVMGSVAAEVLRRAPCPVMVIPARGEHPVGRVQRILAPVDFSAGAKQAAAVARDLAATTGASLELFHVVPDLEVPLPMNPAGLGASMSVVRDLVPAAREALAEMAAQPGPEVSITTEVWHGPPAPTILNRAVETKSDLVVIGTEGHTGLDRLLLGSVAERVARLATVPVLVVPSRSRAES